MRTNAFTLIELMIVIAVIALMVALTFPIIANAKRSGYRTQSISNLRQWVSP
jgi:prepilin-type N-terminal cleavage/methylation domain-containing protein